MRTTCSLVLAMVLLSSSALGMEARVLPSNLVADVERAERRGREIAAAIRSARKAEKAELKQARAQGADLCDFDYRSVSVIDGDASLTYLIATTRRQTDLLIGRHFLLTASGAQPSSKSCLNLGTPTAPAGHSPALMTVTHLLSSAPNEYHVYLSLTQPVPLAVLTNTGIWLVSGGRMELVEREDEGVSADAPADRHQSIGAQQMEAFNAAIAPYVAQARQTWPAARSRYLAGLPRGETFYVTTRLRDSQGRFEQAFVQVARIDGTLISGQIASDIRLVSGYCRGQPYAFQESELMDWTVIRPDGTEEGNVVGKFLDTYRP